MSNDQPLCTREISDESHTVRGTVDVADDGLYSFLAMETTDPNGRQMFKAMTRADWIALADMSEQMTRAWDREEDRQGQYKADREAMMDAVRKLQKETFRANV